MHLSKWFPVAMLAILAPKSVEAQDDKPFIYKPPSFTPPEIPEPDPVPMIAWEYYSEPTTFFYNTTAPDPKNWIGIYYSWGGWPVNGTKVREPLMYAYAPEQEGTVRIDTRSLAPGPYKAFFFAKDGYEELSEHTEFSTVETFEVSFDARDLVTRPAREGENFSIDISRLATSSGDLESKFWRMYCRGDGWAYLTPNGTIYGTPTSESKRNTKMGIKLLSRRNLFYFLEVIIPVRSRDEPMAKTLKVATFNMWNGGRNMDIYHMKQLAFIVEEHLDVVSLQETESIHAVRLAHALGWWAYQTPDCSIISKFPIVEALNATSRSVGVRIAIDGDRQQVVVWGAHLASRPYTPYGICFDNMTRDDVLRAEVDSGRAADADALADALRPYLEDSDRVPVILAGDFNAPSHLDYTNATAETHCGMGEVRWPTSWSFVRAGMIDSFREVHPDPVREPGNTWSPIRLKNKEHKGRPEPFDRIDFLYYAGTSVMEAKESAALVYSEPRPEPHHSENYWTSDHSAVVTTFQLNVE